MRKYFLLFFLLLTFAFQASASHIVGGEFELRYVSGSTYRLGVNLYFDIINGSPGALDDEIYVRIYEKGTNTLKATYTLPLMSESEVSYTELACARPGILRTAKLVYYQDIVLSATSFNQPQGYYVVWERCCRNKTITNINTPEAAGQAFYMEFPPVVMNGEPFRNSSPVLFPPLSDYACVNELFYYDFGGTDPNGDSLVYDLITPQNGTSTPANPRPTAPSRAPYSPISWIGGHNEQLQIKGSPPLTIHPTTGRLTVKPELTGLFVFGVRVREFRDGVKIGEIRRDFQLMVRNDCSPNVKPKVMASEKGKTGFYNSNEVLRISATGERCIEVKFTDPDPTTRITLKTLPINFSNTRYTLSGVTSGTINNSNTPDTLSASLCFPECFGTEGRIYEMYLIATDNGCSQPKQDTLRLRFEIEAIPDAMPELALSLPQPGSVFPPDKQFTVQNGDLVNFVVTGNDTDGDVISITARGIGFNMANQQITFQNRTGVGPITSAFSWPIDCQALQQESYQVEFTVTSQVCGELKTRKEVVTIKTMFPNNIPVISTDKPDLVFELDLNENFEANLFGTDAVDLHPLMLAAAGQGFDLASYGMTFKATGEAGSASGVFNWIANCDAAQQGVVRVDFMLQEDACIPSPDQKLTMEFRVRVPDTQNFIPANIFTPNGDGLNDYFGMPTLPETTCIGTFKRITIFNRWGTEVYSSSDISFQWDGRNVNAGVYYYVIDYSSSVFKGTVTIVH